MDLTSAIRQYEDSICLRVELTKDEAQREAFLLLSYILGKSRSWLFGNPNIKITAQQQQRYLSCIDRRATHEPLAYIIGEWGFYDNIFYVTPDVLVPRPESEALVDWILDNYDSCGNKRLNVLEIGCGSGAIAITLALKRPSWQLTATDISLAALAVTNSNIIKFKKEGFTFNLKTFKSDKFSRVYGKYDIIIANLPYISWSELLGIKELSKEPRLALTDESDGLQLIRQLCAEAPAYFKHNGTLILEHGHRQGIKIANLAAQHGYVKPIVIYDLDHRKRGLAITTPPNRKIKAIL